MKKIFFWLCLTILFVLSSCESHSPQSDTGVEFSNILEVNSTQAEPLAESDILSKSYFAIRDYPDEYADLLNKYCDFIDGGYEIENKEAVVISFSEGLFERVYNTPKEEFGYGLKDINSDGIVDLILMVKSPPTFDGDEYSVYVYALYSLHENTPVLLQNFWSRSSCLLITDDGTIYHRGSGGAAISSLSTYRIADGGGMLITINSLTRIWDSDEKVHYYEYNDEGQEIELSEEEGIELLNKVAVERVENPAPNIEFIPIFKLE